ncbi:MAG TPA: hypothetical protein VFR28_12165 [Allosphingosinicella sp.]|nr:hypothetical protein [Allosphingosinicella sp.]
MRATLAAPISADVKFRAILPMLAVLALLLTPLRMWGGEAMAMPHHAPAAAAAAADDHCAGSHQAPAGKSERPQVNCMMACAAVAPPAHPAVGPAPAAAPCYQANALFFTTGIRPEFEPPPPRLS